MSNMKKRYAKCMLLLLDHMRADIPLATITSRDIPQELLPSEIPKMIVEYLNIRAYGVSHPTEDDRPILNRLSTLQFYKKAISSYMLNGNSHWDDVLNRGNPTKSKEVNDMIKQVVKHEVRHQGVSSKARRAFEYKEFLALCKLIRTKGFKANVSNVEALRWSRLTAMLNFQWQLMARQDDMINLKFETVTTNIEFPFALNCQMRWSKNISEERDAPDQVIFGSMEEYICPLLNLAQYIETAPKCGEVLSKEGHLFGGSKARSGIRRLFDVLLNDEEFHALLSGLIGNHSVRKGSATYAMRSGLSRDHTNRRGRWRVRKQVVDSYIDVNLPYPDSLAAHKLCGPRGSCKYKPNRQVNLPNSFILEKIVPHCMSLLGDAAALLLGHALLWAAFQDKNHRDEDYPLVQTWLRDRIVRSYEETYGPCESQNVDNPIKRISFVPQGVGDQVNIIEIDLDNDDDDDNNEDELTSSYNRIARMSSGGLGDAAAPILAHQITMQRQIEEVKGEMLQQLFELRTLNQKHYRILTSSIKRIAIEPVVRPRALLPGAEAQRGMHGQNINIEDEDDNELLELDTIRLVRLYKHPKSLFDLWKEYQFGLNGEKPAKEFTLEERGKNKSMYCRRKVFWDVIRSMVRAGHTSHTAIDKVYLVYGRGTSVTKILLKMIRDRKEGGHPSLTV